MSSPNPATPPGTTDASDEIEDLGYPEALGILMHVLQGLERQGHSPEDVRFAVGYAFSRAFGNAAALDGLRCGMQALAMDALAPGGEMAVKIVDLVARIERLEKQSGIQPKRAKSLSTRGRKHLFMLASTGSPEKADVPPDVADTLIDMGYLVREEDRLRITTSGRHQLNISAQIALNRPDRYWDLSSEEQWSIDKELGILDWDGTC
jgi:hypothetical protein